MSDTWYFAYGSNLSKGRIQKRTGLIRCAKRALLRDYRLVFNKRASKGNVYANIQKAEGVTVWGVIYLCNAEAMAKLDHYEGVKGGHYERQPVEVQLEDGSRQAAIAYVACVEQIVSEGMPSAEYLGHILTGAAEHLLPDDYIQMVRRLGEETVTDL